MASTVALFTGLSGLNAHARRLEVIGNNISNVNTTAFKSSRMEFSSQISRNLSLGMGPTAENGGVNPSQVGMGVRIAGTQRNTSAGPLSVTGIQTDLAIDGGGYFLVERDGQEFYTRSGAFQFNAQNELVTLTGERLQGYGIDDNFNIQEGVLTPISIPLGQMTLAEATDNVDLTGNLRADGDVATTGTVLDLDALTTGGGAPITLATALTSLEPAGTFDIGDAITISGAERGGKVAPDATFTIEDGTETVQDFLEFLQSILGVVPDGGYEMGDVTGAPEPGSFSVDAMGVIQFIGNWGEMNDLTLQSEHISVVDSMGGAKTSPFGISKSQEATGESVRTTFVTYDSLGTEMVVDVTMVLAATDANGTYWRTFLHSADDSNQALYLESGDRNGGMFNEAVPLLSFDSFGRLTSSSSIQVEVDRAGTGASDPVTFDLNFSSSSGELTAFSDSGGGSAIGVSYVDGAPYGVLSSFSVGPDGTIVGGFTNNRTRALGQIVLATFNNDAGLVDVANNLFQIGANSGTPLLTTPGQFGTGQVIGGALELSNVDLGAEFINMISTSTGYSASSRVISTADQLIQQLLVLGR
ncbi:MAG: flagellar hook-basal body complex protein [Phycisphaerales bacterium]|nr:flagellar hook-basal body complex protein [Phycisphaerales bacterium]